MWAVRPARRHSSLHLLVSVRQEMVECLDPNEAKARILHVGDDVERNGHRSGEQYHMYPAARGARGHAETSKKRTPKTKTEEHCIDDLRRVLFACAPTRLRSPQKAYSRPRRFVT